MDRNNRGSRRPYANDEQKGQTALYTVPSRGYTANSGRTPVPRKDYDSGHRQPPRRKPENKRTGPKKSSYSALFAIIICTGVVICVAAFALIFTNLTQNAGQGTARANPGPNQVQGGVPGGVRRETTDTALIRAVDTGTNTFTLYGIASGETYFATWTSSTEMRDRHGNSLLPGQFRPGDVVDVRHWEDDTVLLSIQQNGEARTFTDISGLAVTMSGDPNDPVLGRIRHGNNNFVFGQELIAVSGEEDFDLANLSTVDRVTMRTFRHTLLFLEVTAGSGEIEVIFNEHIRGGNITIGLGVSGTYSRLAESRTFTVAEGIHQVTIRGDNIEDINRDVLVRSGETTVIDLYDAQFRSGVISFSSNIDNVHLTVNDQAWDIGQNLTSRYGTFSIRATSFGYQIYENTFELNQPFVNYNIVMEPLPTPPPPTPRVHTRPVTFSTNVGNAAIYIDGYFAGRTSDAFGQDHTLTIQVEVGTRQISIRLDGFNPIENSAIFVADDMREHFQHFTLHPMR